MNSKEKDLHRKQQYKRYTGSSGMHRFDYRKKRIWRAQPIHSKSKIAYLRYLIPAICAGLFLFSSVKLILYFVNSQNTKATNEILQEIYETSQESSPMPEIDSPTDEPAITTTPQPTVTPQPEATPAPESPKEYQLIGTEILPELQQLYAQNSDLVGWLNIPGVVNLPVVYRNNSYYLTHDFFGKKISSGALFLDEYHPFTAETQYLVIHGHNMNDGSMFGLLSHYRKISYIREHGIVSFSTLYRQESYAVIAVLVVPQDYNNEGYVTYTGTPVFRSDGLFDSFINSVLNRSIYTIPIDVDRDDALLTLSTCFNDDRLIIVCRRFRENESKADILIALSRTRER